MVMNQNRRFRRTTIISAGLLAFLVGLYSVKVIDIQVGLVAVTITSVYMLLFRRRTVMTLVAVVLFGLVLGAWRGGTAQEDISKYRQHIGSNVTVSGRVLDDPVYDDKGRQDFRVGSVVADGQELPGQVRVKAHINGLRRGDSVRTAGTLRDGFGNYQASIYFADVEITARSNSPVETLRREFFAAVYSVLPEPHASLGLGFLVGLRSALPEDFEGQLKIAGLTHIVVASGFNLTILVRLSRRLLANYSKYQAFVGSVALILAFLAVTGASPSIVRASVVTVLSLLAWYYGRRFQPVLIILLGAALTAGYNPLFIWHDVGWWLSFLAFAGVLILAPLITTRLYGEKTPPMLMQVAIETTAAQIMATPLILSLFGEVSLVALFANMAVVPLIPFAMLTTFVAGLAGLVLSGGLAAWLAVPSQLVLGYIVSVTRFFAAPSWAQQEVSFTGVSMLIFYAAVAAVTIVFYKRSKLAFEKIPSVVE